MRTVATEMERAGFQVPLLIGGATTSRAHTAVRIEPAYSGPVVHVIDASRAVGVARALLDPAQHDAFVARTREEYETVRTAHEGRDRKEARLTLTEARAQRLRIDWTALTPPAPTFLGPRAILDQPLEELVERIDWSPFFTTWELAGQYPRILADPVVGKAATDLFRDAQRLLDRIVAERLLHANAVVGFWPAAATPDDDIEVYADETRGSVVARFHTLRQQMAKTNGRPDVALSDYTAPIGSGVADHVGLFAVTAGIGLEELRARFRPTTMTTARSWLRRSPTGSRRRSRSCSMSASGASCGVMPRTRRWTTTHSSRSGTRASVPRPATPRAPTTPRNAPSSTCWTPSGPRASQLTESMAMLPGASVSGYYFWHPEARYFGLGRIDRDQLEDYARRKGWSAEEAERWLAPNLMGGILG